MAKNALLRFIRHHWIAVLIVVLGFSLRIYRIDHQSVWYDEAFSLTVSRLLLREMTAQIVRDFVHPPLFYYALHGWFELFGFGVFQARLWSTLCGTLAIVAVYILATYLFDRRIALLSALLLTVSQVGVMYSQEARPYAQLLLLVTCSSTLFAISLRTNRALPWWGFVCCSLLMIYTHYYGFIVLACLALYAAIYKKRYRLRPSLVIGGILIAVLLYLPWVTSGVVDQALSSPKTARADQPPWFVVHWWSFFDTVDRFNNDRLAGLLAPPPVWAFLAGVLLFGIPVCLALKSWIQSRNATPVEYSHQERLMFLGFLTILPIIIALGSSFFHLQYNARYVIFCAAPYYILVASGIFTLIPRLQKVLVVLILIYSGYALKANYFLPYKENYRDALSYLAREYKEGDCCVFSPFGGIPLQWSIYQGNKSRLRVANVATSEQLKCNRIWFIQYSRVPWAIQRNEEAKRKLEHSHSRVRNQEYFWVAVSLYTPKK